MKKFILILAALLFAVSCKDDPTSPVVPVEPAQNGLLIINEGLYGQNNSTITLFNFEKNEIQQNGYRNANSGSKLGDTANDIFILNGKAYITVDNSNKIEVIDVNTLKSLGIIDLSGSGHPRELVLIDSLKGYATSLSDKVIYFNPTTKNVIKEIVTGSKPEGIVFSNGRIFTANSGFGAGNTVSVINTSSNEIEQTVTVGLNPREILVQNNFVYVICSGKFDPVGRGGIYKINSSTLAIEDSIIINKNPGEACIAGEKLLAVNGDGVHKIELSNFTISSQLLIKSKDVNSSNSIIYSIHYNAFRKEIYCGNPKDYQQNGEVVIYDLNGSELRRIICGINPGSIKTFN